jgi:hypothetical protein
MALAVEHDKPMLINQTHVHTSNASPPPFDRHAAYAFGMERRQKFVSRGPRSNAIKLRVVTQLVPEIARRQKQSRRQLTVSNRSATRLRLIID